MQAQTEAEVQLVSFLTSTLEGGRWTMPRPITLSQERAPVPIVQEPEWTQGPVRTRVGKGRPWFQTFTMFWIYYVFFWVVPQRLNYICRRFGTLYMFHLRHAPYIPHPSATCFCLRTTPYLSPPFLSASAISKSNLFLYNTPTVLSSSHTSHHLPMKMEQIECSETSAYIIQTPGNYPKENIIWKK